MKIRNIIYSVLAAAFAVTGCKEEPAPAVNQVNFTVRYSELSYNFAIINVKHDGPEDITWHGFVTEDVTTNDFELFYGEYEKVLTSPDGISGLKKETERNILLENLKENTEYKYIVFGLKPDGALYENVGIGSIEFKTTTNIYNMTRTEDWTISYLGRNEDKSKELIEVKSNKGGRFAWQYIKKESLEEFDKTYPDGYELWEDGIYMATVDAIELFALEQISTIQYYMTNGYNLVDLTYVYEADKPFEVDRLSSGDYYIIVYGFQGDGQHTQTYSVKELTIEEEASTPEYDRWLGTYTFTGDALVTQDNGEEVLETRNYNITIEKYDNNFMYRIHGWECGGDVAYDWEEDIMQLDKSKGEFLAFPAYYKDGSLEIRESPMTYITFDGQQSLVLGIYGYAFNKEMNEEIPVILDDTPMALVEPIAEGETTTTINGLKAEYTDPNSKKKTEWEYCKMGYIAWSELNGAWQTINPPMRFPITVTKVSDEIEGGNAVIATQNGGMELFATKKVSTDFLNKDFSKLAKMKPEIFDRQL